MKMILFIALLLSTTLVQAVYENSLEVRYAAFFPTSENFRESTNFFGNNFQIEASHQFYDCLEIWSNFNWYDKKGEKRVRDNPFFTYKVRTHVEIANLSFGLNTYYNFAERFTVYAGLGASFAEVLLKTRTPFKPQKAHTKLAIGGVSKLGLDYLLAKNVYFTVFADYLYIRVKLKHIDDISGLKIGLGLGIKI